MSLFLRSHMSTCSSFTVSFSSQWALQLQRAAACAIQFHGSLVWKHRSWGPLQSLGLLLSFVPPWSWECNSISPLYNLIWTNVWFWLRGPCDQNHVLRASACTVDLCSHLSDKRNKHTKEDTLTGINAHMHRGLALWTHIHTHIEPMKLAATQLTGALCV